MSAPAHDDNEPIDPIEAATLPWHRAVAADGRLGTPTAGPDGPAQRALLAAEGVAFDPEGRIADVVARRVDVAALPHAVPVLSTPLSA